MTGAAPAALRGDYRNAGDDFVVAQNWPAYGETEHALWRRLYARQSAMLPRYACPQFMRSLAALGAASEIPRLDAISQKLRSATGWELVGVPGLIPDEAFFTHLANRRFPVTVWLRKPEEFDYIVEPDVFHDFFGHVPLLFEATYADHLYEYGKGGLKAHRLGALKQLARLYWYSIEFGLLQTPQGLRAYGAGLLSSGSELAHCIDSPAPQRLAFALERILRTDYRIDRFQDSYFVIDSFESLLAATAPDFAPIYSRLKQLPALAPDARVEGDRPLR
jgi:phenylalanine-4-hydroxylase